VHFVVCVRRSMSKCLVPYGTNSGDEDDAGAGPVPPALKKTKSPGMFFMLQVNQMNLNEVETAVPTLTDAELDAALLDYESDNDPRSRPRSRPLRSHALPPRSPLRSPAQRCRAPSTRSASMPAATDTLANASGTTRIRFPQIC